MKGFRGNGVVLSQGSGSGRSGVPAHINMDFNGGQDRWRTVFESPEDLLNHFRDYVAFAQENPIYITEKATTRDGVQLIPVPKARPLSKRDFALYCGVSEIYFSSTVNRQIKRWEESGDERKKLWAVQMREAMALVVDTINSQNYSGAAVGIFKEGLMVASLELDRHIQEAKEQKAPQVSREDLKKLSQDLEDEY